jgi:UDP-2-acetamido-3-amino-2,3-dideoxy-glucuronate N-acetyltransferase
VASDLSFFVHPSSVVDPGATIGAGTKIWHFCHVFSGATIGRNCTVGQGCSIAARAVLGNGVKLQNGVSVYDGVVLEDDVFCGPHMVFTNVINPRAFLSRKDEFRPTRIARGATIGAAAVIVCGHAIGAYAMVGAGAVVTRDVPAFALVFGNPARQRGWVDASGQRLMITDGESTLGQDGNRYALRDGKVVMEDAP